MKKNSFKPMRYMLSYVEDSKYFYNSLKYTDKYFYLPYESSLNDEIRFPYENEFKNYVPSKFNPFIINNIEYTIYAADDSGHNRNRILLIQENINIDPDDYNFNLKDIKDGFDFGFFVATISTDIYPSSQPFLVFLDHINYFLAKDSSWKYYFSDYEGFLKGYYSFIKDKNIRDLYVNLYPTNPLMKYVMNFYQFIKNNDGNYSGTLSYNVDFDIYRTRERVDEVKMFHYYMNNFLFNEFIEWGLIEEDKDFRIKIRKLNSNDVEEIIRERLRIKSKNPLRRLSSVKKKKKSSIRRLKRHDRKTFNKSYYT